MQHAPQSSYALPGISVTDAATVVLRAPGALATLFHGAIMILIPLAGQIALYGWVSEMMHRMHAGAEQPVPKLRLGDFGYWLGRGVVPFVANLLFGMAISMAVNVVVLPVMLLGVFGAMAASPDDPSAFFGLMFLIMVASMGMSLLVMPLYSSGMARAELTEDFSHAFDFSWIMRFTRKMFWPHIWTGALMMLLGFLMTFGGMLFFFIGMFLAVPMVMAMTGHVRAQLYRRYVFETGDTVPVRHPEWCPAEAAEHLPNYYA